MTSLAPYRDGIFSESAARLDATSLSDRGALDAALSPDTALCVESSVSEAIRVDFVQVNESYGFPVFGTSSARFKRATWEQRSSTRFRVSLGPCAENLRACMRSGYATKGVR